MRPTQAALVALLVVATCTPDAQKGAPALESSKAALGTIPPSEVAAWQEVGTPNSPSRRFLQAAAFDEARKVVVMFGGTTISRDSGNNPSSQANQETWEWDPATGKWTNRTTTATKPESRSGAAMVYDSARSKLVLFGGRTSTGLNLQDTWEWDGKTGVWTAIDIVKNLPPARAQHAMVFEKSTGKALLFGGGRSSSNSDDAPLGIAVSFGDTWQYDPVAQGWTQLTPPAAPAARHDFGLVWDSARNRAVLFGGLAVVSVGDKAVGKQDVWEWDPSAGTWAEGTSSGDKPSARHAHAMAFDASRKMVVLFGGWDPTTGLGLRDLWDWDPTNGAWTLRRTGSEPGMPWGHVYSSLLPDDGRARLLLVAGGTGYIQSDIDQARTATFDWRPNRLVGTREVWELDPAESTVTDRTPAYNVPSGRWAPAMGYSPSSGKVYLFGGMGQGLESGTILNDTWEWDGQTWAQIITDVKPDPREEVAMAYDPVRKSMILYGGRWAGMVGSVAAGDYRYERRILGDTWELDATGKWTKLTPKASPEPLFQVGMATDTTRQKILLYAGAGMESKTGQPTKDYLRNTVWEWDGAAGTWTDRTPMAASRYPSGSCPWTVAYDEARRKMFLYDGSTAPTNEGTSEFWEWDPSSAGWALRGGERLSYMLVRSAAYDSIRRRMVLLSVPNNGTGTQNTTTWEIDTQGPTWYMRSQITQPGAVGRVAFDSKRGVVVGFSGEPAFEGDRLDDTWEYKVSSLANGEGCTAAFASLCASGFCTDGVCCEVAACSGSCKTCNVPGTEGTCAAVKAGTVVAGSCDGKACAADGKCLAKNGEACTSAGACASGFCADGVCCESACDGHCVSCNQAGQAGTCRPFAVGTDPEKECGVGTGACRSTCDGVGACVFPIKYMLCGDCMTCDGAGECKGVDRQCAGLPPATTGTGGTGGSTLNPYATGSGGSVTGSGGAGGAFLGSGGASGGGGNGGTSTASGGAGGGIAGAGGIGGGNGGQAGNGGQGGQGSGGMTDLHDAGFATGGAGGASSGTVSAPRDAGVASADAALVATLRREGCSCDMGGKDSSADSVPWLLIVGSAVFMRRARRQADRPRSPG